MIKNVCHVKYKTYITTDSGGVCRPAWIYELIVGGKKGKYERSHAVLEEVRNSPGTRICNFKKLNSNVCTGTGG